MRKRDGVAWEEKIMRRSPNGSLILQGSKLWDSREVVGISLQNVYSPSKSNTTTITAAAEFKSLKFQIISKSIKIVHGHMSS